MKFKSKFIENLGNFYLVPVVAIAFLKGHSGRFGGYPHSVEYKLEGRDRVVEEVERGERNLVVTLVEGLMQVCSMNLEFPTSPTFGTSRLPSTLDPFLRLQTLLGLQGGGRYRGDEGG